MIYNITGILKEKNPTSVFLNVNGVGLELRIPISTFEKLPALEKQCTLFTHLYLNLNQDEVRLYGFSTLAEKTVFIRLIAISGIGPKIALSIISSMNINMFIKAILNEEDGLLARVPGIGKKTALRIIIELKDDVAQFAQLIDSTDRLDMDSSFIEVEKALIALGYNSKDVHKVYHKMSDEDKQQPVEQQIKKVIRLLYQQ